MSDRPLLSDLCTIWCENPRSESLAHDAHTDLHRSYSEKPKYRCPRCQTQTCSLPCYKKHQTRASCNGQRDPSRYLKKNQLATPAGIDHDYNYLKSVERHIEKANTECSTLSSRLTPQDGLSQDQTGSSSSESALAAASRTATRARNPAGALQKYLRDNNITVEYAPLGMSRQRNNLTRNSNRGKILWTIEWVELERPGSDKKGEAESVLEHDCWAESSVAATYEHFCAERRNAEKKRRQSTSSAVAGSSGHATLGETHAQGANKRKRGSEDEPPQISSSSTGEALDQQQADYKKDDDHTSKADATKSTDTDSLQSVQIDSAKAPSFEEPAQSSNLTEPGDTNKSEPSQSPTQDQRSFYLLVHPAKGHTSETKSKGTIVSLQTGSCKFTHALRGHTFPEFPTILVTTGVEPPSGYTILDQDDEGSIGSDTVGRGSMPAEELASVSTGRQNSRHSNQYPISRTETEATSFRQTGGKHINRENAETAAAEQVDPQAILQMLRRDLRS